MDFKCPFLSFYLAEPIGIQKVQISRLQDSMSQIPRLQTFPPTPDEHTAYRVASEHKALSIRPGRIGLRFIVVCDIAPR